jgi:hypothetical protein
VLTLKDFSTGDQQKIPRGDVAEHLRSLTKAIG